MAAGEWRRPRGGRGSNQHQTKGVSDQELDARNNAVRKASSSSSFNLPPSRSTPLGRGDELDDDIEDIIDEMDDDDLWGSPQFRWDERVEGLINGTMSVEDVESDLRSDYMGSYVDAVIEESRKVSQGGSDKDFRILMEASNIDEMNRVILDHREDRSAASKRMARIASLDTARTINPERFDEYTAEMSREIKNAHRSVIDQLGF